MAMSQFYWFLLPTDQLLICLNQKQPTSIKYLWACQKFSKKYNNNLTLYQQ